MVVPSAWPEYWNFMLFSPGDIGTMLGSNVTLEFCTDTGERDCRTPLIRQGNIVLTDELIPMKADVDLLN